MLSRRTLLGSLTAVGLWPFRPRLAQAGTGLTFSYGWDPDVAAPTEASLYVAPDGDDTADGSLARPLRTLRRAVDLLATLPGGSLSIRGGIYREMITLDALQGQPDTPYLIHRHGQERVQITAAEVLTGWEPCPQDEAATLGLAPQGVFVTRFPKTLLVHGSHFALNLHEAGVWCSIAMDRADMRDPTRNGDHDTYHNAEFVLDAEDRITAIRDPRLIGMPATQMQQVRALIYHSPNLISPGEIASFDPATGTITLADPGFVVQRKGDEYVMHYALQNLATALQDGQWIARETGADQIAVYLRPRDPATLEADIEVSLRPTCMDLGRAQHLTLLLYTPCCVS